MDISPSKKLIYVNVLACCYSPTGNEILVSSSARALTLWHVGNDRPIQIFDQPMPTKMRTVTYLPQKNDIHHILGIMDEGSLRVWNSRNANTIYAITDRSSLGIRCAAYLPEAEQIAYGTELEKLTVFNTKTKKTIISIDTSGPVLDCCYSPDGKWLITNEGNLIIKREVANISDVSLLLEPTDRVISRILFFPDNKLLIAQGDKLKIQNIDGEANIRQLGIHKAPIVDCAISPNGKWVISAAEKILKLWSVEHGICVANLTGHHDIIKSCSFSPDGSKIVSCGGNEICFWDIAPALTQQNIELAFQTLAQQDIIALQRQREMGRAVASDAANEARRRRMEQLREELVAEQARHARLLEQGRREQLIREQERRFLRQRLAIAEANRQMARVFARRNRIAIERSLLRINFGKRHNQR